MLQRADICCAATLVFEKVLLTMNSCMQLSPKASQQFFMILISKASMSLQTIVMSKQSFPDTALFKTLDGKCFLPSPNHSTARATKCQEAFSFVSRARSKICMAQLTAGGFI